VPKLIVVELGTQSNPVEYVTNVTTTSSHDPLLRPVEICGAWPYMPNILVDGQRAPPAITLPWTTTTVYGSLTLYANGTAIYTTDANRPPPNGPVVPAGGATYVDLTAWVAVCNEEQLFVLAPIELRVFVGMPPPLPPHVDVPYVCVPAPPL
jgi:hypothetical protein